MEETKPDMGGAVYSLLVQGKHQSEIATTLNISRKSVYRYTRSFERKKLIMRVFKQPAIYTKYHSSAPPLYAVKECAQELPIMLPHKFGADFYQNGKPNLKYNNRGNAYLYELSHTVRFGRYTTTIWLSSFRGKTINEIIDNGRKDVADLAEFYAAKFNIRLSFNRLIPGIEWCKTSKEDSTRYAKIHELAPTEKHIVAGAVHVYGDSSHPETVEYNALPKGDKARPTDHAKVDEYIYSGKLNADLYAIKEVLAEVQGGMTAIRIRMDLEAKK